MEKKIPTQNDIARIVGVSQRAVAAVVGNGGTNYSVGPKTRERILKVASELGYRPYRNAQLFRGVKSGLIGYFRPLSMHEYRREQTLCLAQEIQAFGFRMVSLDVIHEVGGIEQELEFLYDSQVEGLIISHFSYHLTELPIFDLFVKKETPVVILEEPKSDAQYQLPSVYRDTQQGMRDLNRYLFNQGFESVAMVAMWQKEQQTAAARINERVKGYEEALEENGLTPDLVWVERVEQSTWLDSSFDAGCRGMRILLERSRLPDVICFQNDYMAQAALNECRRHNVTVPDDVAISGFNDQSLGSFTMPTLTSVAHPVEEVASQAAKLLMEIKEGKREMVPPPQIPVPCIIKPRESTIKVAKNYGNP